MQRRWDVLSAAFECDSAEFLTRRDRAAIDAWRLQEATKKLLDAAIAVGLGDVVKVWK